MEQDHKQTIVKRLINFKYCSYLKQAVARWVTKLQSEINITRVNLDTELTLQVSKHEAVVKLSLEERLLFKSL